MPLAGKVVTGDALFAQRGLCEQITGAGGDYLFIVKGNQPQLQSDIALLFANPPWGEQFAQAEQRGRHGDRREVRTLRSSTALVGYVDWPRMRQVCKMERLVKQKGRQERDVRYAITSLGTGVTADKLLSLVRGHWAIENKLHWVRDVTFGEDQSQIRKGSTPQVMAALRNVVLGILRRAGAKNIAATLRHNGWRQNSRSNPAAFLCYPKRE